MEATQIVLLLVALVQVVAIGLGSWVLATLVKILGVLAGIKKTIDFYGADLQNLQTFQRESESKVKELWSWYKHFRRRNPTYKLDKRE